MNVSFFRIKVINPQRKTPMNPYLDLKGPDTLDTIAKKNDNNNLNDPMTLFFDHEKENFLVKHRIEEKLRSNRFNAIEEKKNNKNDKSFLLNISKNSREHTPTPTKGFHARIKPNLIMQKNRKESEDDNLKMEERKTPLTNYRTRKYREISRNI